MPKIIKIVGPPGTGKTYYMLEQIEQACDRFIPKEIGCVSHTVAAVSEARNRVVKKLNVSYKDIPNIKTVHSHCFHLLGVKNENVMETAKNIREFNEQYPAFQISGGGDKTDDQKEYEGNNNTFNQMQIMRSRLIPKDKWPAECQQFHSVWSEYMENEGKIDFNGMLEECLRRELSPNIKVLMVDEAQDLPAIQTALIKQWGEQCETVMWLGDGNQAIFRFAGADPDLFINLKADKVIPLEQSYRLSPEVLRKSMEIIQQANIKEMVDFRPTSEYGQGQVMKVRHPDLSLPGSHMILCRCKFQLKKYISALRKANIPYHNPYRLEDKTWNPLELDGAESVKIYLDMHKGKKLNSIEIKQMAKNCIVKSTMKRGTKKNINKLPVTDQKQYELFELIPMGFNIDFLNKQDKIRDYFRINSESADMIFNLAENNPKMLTEKPRICVGTFHAVKGGEADNVWIDTGITTKIRKAIYNDTDAWDSEVRCAYVGVTRARQTVGIMPTQGQRNPFL